MKIQINGFDIEINTEEANLSMKVMDANGKELSNNTYTQTEIETEEVTDVEVPSAEDAATEEPVEDTEEETTEEEPVEDTEEETTEEPVEDTEEETLGESYMPDLETYFKK
jgi:hypothetical protein